MIRLEEQETWWSERDFRQNAEPGAIGGSGRTKIRTIEQGMKERKKGNPWFFGKCGEVG